MNTKRFALLSTTILALILVVSVVGAATLNFNQNSNSQTFDIKNEGIASVNVNFPSIITSTSGMTFNVSIPANNKTLEVNETKTITVTPTQDVADYIDFLKSETITFNITEVNELITVNVKNNEYCTQNDTGDLEITDISYDVNHGFGEDDEWFPFDEIEVEIDIENNNNNDDIDNIEIEWALFDSDGNEVMGDDVSENLDLKDGDDDTLTFTFVLDEDVDELKDETYTFAVRATGEVQDDDEYDTCNSKTESINMQIEKDFVIVAEVSMPKTINNGDEFTLSAEVWNIGSKNQDDVTVRVYIPDLDVEEIVTLGDIDSLESEDLSLLVKIPKNAEGKTYIVQFTVFDEDNDVYENDFDDEESIVTFPLEVINNGPIIPEYDASVSANLVTENPTAGKEVIVDVTITNTGEETSAFNLRALSFQNWAEDVELSQSSFVLTAGDSKVVQVTFNTDKKASGENSFDVEVSANGNIVRTQPVSLSIEPKSGFFSSMTGNIIGSNNAMAWGIGIANMILIMIIVFVAIRIIRK